MAVTTVAPVPAVEVAPRRWTVEEFERIPDGVFPEGERVELIEGLIYTNMGQNDPHYFALHYAIELVRAAFGEGFIVVNQAPTRFAEGSKVEPDLLVLRGRLRDYEGRRVDPPADVALLVEVSDTSLAYDTTVKATLYAKQGVPEYWIVNLQNRTLEVRRRPRPEMGAYAETVVFREDESVAVGSGSVAVGDLFPRATSPD